MEWQRRNCLVPGMPRLLVLLVVAALLAPREARASPVVSEEQLQKAAKMVRGVCQPKSGATDDQLAVLARGTISDAREVKCYIACLMTTVRTLKRGKIDAKMMKMQAEKMMPPDKRDASIAALAVCKDADGADDCEVGYNYITCAQKVDPEKFFFPV